MHWLNGAFRVTVFEQFSPASGASGNAQGITYAKLSIEATPNSLIQMQALAHLDHWFQLLPNDVWQHTGVLLLAQNQQQLAHHEKLLNALPDCHPLMLPVSKVDASDLCGQALNYGGLHIPSGGWLNPKRCVETLLKHPLIQVQTYHRITSVESTIDGAKLRSQSRVSKRSTIHAIY